MNFAEKGNVIEKLLNEDNPDEEEKVIRRQVLRIWSDEPT